MTKENTDTNLAGEFMTLVPFLRKQETMIKIMWD